MFLLFIYLSIFLISFSNGKDVPGYYWRDFDGTIPSDAFPGGLDVNNRPIYIGQVYAKFLIPAKIYSRGQSAYYEYGGKEFEVRENIKILCTQHPEQFQWILTNNDLIKQLSGVYLVIGGYEPGCTTYIGRIRAKGEVLVGKALADNLPIFAGLYVTKNEVAERHTTFEVLTFNSTEENVLDVLNVKSV